MKKKHGKTRRATAKRQVRSQGKSTNLLYTMQEQIAEWLFPLANNVVAKLESRRRGFGKPFKALLTLVEHQWYLGPYEEKWKHQHRTR